MDRRQLYYRQLVADVDITQVFDDAEHADHNASSDLGFAGIMSGLVASQHGFLGNYTVDVTGGVAYDQLGQRIYVPSTQNVDLSVDYLSTSTNVAGAANSKVISLFLKFNRANGNPKTDGNGATVLYDELESYQWVVVQGAEALTGTQTPPSHIANALLICNVTIAFSVAPQLIVTGDINQVSPTNRDDLVAFTGSALTVRRGNIIPAIGDLVTWVNNFIAGSGSILPGSAVSYPGSGTWVNAITGVAAGSVTAALTAIVADLGGFGGGISGADRVSAPTYAGVSITLSSGSIASQLAALSSAANIDMVASGALLDTTTIGAASLKNWLLGLIQTLSEQVPSGSHVDGASIIGARSTSWFTVGSVRSHLDRIAAQFTTAAAFTGSVTLSQVPAFTGTPVTLAHHQELRVANVANQATGFALTTQASAVLADGSISLFGGSGQLVVSRKDTATGDYFDLPLDLPDGATFSGVVISTVGLDQNPTTLPSYQIFKADGKTNIGVLSAAITDGHTTGPGNWLTSIVDTSVPISVGGSSVVVDRSTYTYFVRVFCPFENSFGGCRVAVCRLTRTHVPTKVVV